MATAAIRTTPSRYRLSPRLRKIVLAVHIGTSIGWMGVDIALFALMMIGLRTDDAVTALSAYNAVAIIIPWSVPVLALSMLGSGVLLGWGTKWGLVTYWWVAIKLAQAIVLNILVFVALLPGVADLELSDTTLTADGVRDHLGSATIDMLFPPIVSFTMLAISLVLSVWKPVRKTPWADR
jgi:hypothetical protein